MDGTVDSTRCEEDVGGDGSGGEPSTARSAQQVREVERVKTGGRARRAHGEGQNSGMREVRRDENVSVISSCNSIKLNA